MAAKKVTKKVQSKATTPRARKPIDPDKMEVVDQIVHIFMKSGKGKNAKSKHLAAAILGAAFGGFVPIASYVVAHVMLAGIELADAYTHLATYFVIGGLLYSAPTVYAWLKKAVGSDDWIGRIKPFGFVLLLEGVMLINYDHIAVQAVSYAALGFLVFINAVSSGCKLALRRTAGME